MITCRLSLVSLNKYLVIPCLTRNQVTLVRNLANIAKRRWMPTFVGMTALLFE